MSRRRVFKEIPAPATRQIPILTIPPGDDFVTFIRPVMAWPGLAFPEPVAL
jgi:hypothetical protein